MLHIITITNSLEHKNVDNLRKSVYPNYLHVINDYDTKLKNLSKIYKIYDYINKSNFLNDDILCIVDGHDVVFNKKKYNVQDIILQFQKLKTDIIFSTENKCSHHSVESKKYFELEHNGYYLNSGIIIAFKQKYIDFLKDIIDNIDIYNKEKYLSDQRIYGNYISQNKCSNIKMDIDNIFGFTLNSNTNIEYKNIKSFFIHVTFLSNSCQYLKYQNVIKSLDI
jgi:hypothetical protein